MSGLWHPDGELHHPALSPSIAGELVAEGSKQFVFESSPISGSILRSSGSALALPVSAVWCK